MPRSSRRRYVMAALVVFALPAAAKLALCLTPFPQALAAPPVQSCDFVDREGRPLRAVLVDERRYARRCTLDEVSVNVIRATIAAEDRRFYAHGGVDLRAVGRAGWQ